jgi:FkbM family methyltransferase
MASLAQLIRKFIRSSRRGKYAGVVRRIHRVLPGVPAPFRLPFGSWWLARGSALDHQILLDGFENDAMRFITRFLKPGMNVLDIGAHHGLYTLLASKCVSPGGSVVAFEPSPRERERLLQHVRLNSCQNVSLEPFALAEVSGTATLYVVDGWDDWCNSLRPPAINQSSRAVQVKIIPLDDYLSRRSDFPIDFIKLDVEGAELSVLRGAARLLRGVPRPVVLAEVQDVRTKPWNYRAREIIDFLTQYGYEWFGISGDGILLPMPAGQETFDGNFVAVPSERIAEIACRLQPTGLVS